MKKISVVIPMFNSGIQVKKMINSLLNQSILFYELIIVDDGSTDNSLKICEEYCMHHKNIFIYHTKNNGSGPARNYGISKATGEYIFFPDADDILEIDALLNMQNKLEEDNFDLIVFGYKIINSNGSVNEKEYENRVFGGEFVRDNYYDFCCMEAKFGIQGAPWNKLFKLSIIKDNLILFPALRRHQDEAFIAKYMSFAQNVAFCDKKVYIYYANNIKKEWEKYPSDYVDIVIQLINNREETILSWNKADIKTRDRIGHELICKSIKSLETLFYPKSNYKNMKTRIFCIKNSIRKLYFSNYTKNSVKELGIYQRITLNLIGHKRLLLLYFLLRFKTYIETHEKIISTFRRLFGAKVYEW